MANIIPEAGSVYVRGSGTRRKVIAVDGENVTYEGLLFGNETACTLAEFNGWLGDNWCLVSPEMAAFGERGFA